MVPTMPSFFGFRYRRYQGLSRAGSDQLGAFFFEVSQNKLAVASLFLESFLTFAFLLVLFLTPHAKSREGQHFQASQLDLAFATLADAVAFVFDALKSFVDRV